MSDVEIRRRIIPPLPRDLDYRPPYLRAAEQEMLDGPAMNAPDHRGAEMLSTEAAITQDSLPALLYRWSKSDLAAANIAKPPALLQRNDLRQDQYAKSPGIPAGAVVGRVAD
jgi:hypothetical protein